MLKKIKLLMVLLSLATGLPLSASVTIATLYDIYELGDLAYLYSNADGDTKYITFYSEDVAGLTDKLIENYLTDPDSRQSANRIALDFVSNEVGRYLLDEGYELFYFGVYGIGLTADTSGTVTRLGYYAMLAKPTEERLATRAQSNSDDQLLTLLNHTELERYLAKNKLSQYAGRYQTGVILSFAASDLFEYEELEDDGEMLPLLVDFYGRHEGQLISFGLYQELIAAGYVLLNFEPVAIDYDAESSELSAVKYHVLLGKE